MSAKADAIKELRNVLDMSLYYAKHTFPWALSQPIVYLCKSADQAGTKSSVNGNVLSALYLVLHGEDEGESNGCYIEGLENLVQDEGICYLEEDEPGQNSLIFEELNRVFGTSQPEVTPENVVIVRSKLLSLMTKDVKEMAGLHFHKTPDYRDEVISVIDGPEVSLELEAAATEFLDTLGTDCNVGII